MRYTNDVSLVLIYVVCAALLVLVAAGWRVLSRPGAPDNRLLTLLRAHRWEALLLLGLPIAAGALDTGLTVVALDLNNVLLWEHKHYVWRVLALAALVVAYPRVRGQGSELLVLLWQLLMVLKATSLALYGVQDLLGYDGVIVSHEVYYGGTFDETAPVNIVSVMDILWALTLVWFMRLASRTSLSRAFLLLGLSMAYQHIGPNLTLLQTVLAPWWSLQALAFVAGALAALLIEVGLNVLMFWVLMRHETLDVRVMRSAAILLVAAGLLFRLVSYALVIGSVTLGTWWSYRSDSLLYPSELFSPSEYLSANLAAYAIVFAQQVGDALLVALLAYLVRARRPVGPSETHAGAPP